MNGVTNSVLQVLSHLRRRGDEVTVIAPSDSLWWEPAVATEQRELCAGFPVLRVPSLPLPDYPKVRVAAGFTQRIRNILEDIQPDVVHVASPFVLGWRAIQAANSLGLPTVSIYQTEVPAYAARYRIPWAEELLWQHVDRMHQGSTLTLVPSSFCKDQLRARGIKRLKTWRRGVDMERFDPGRRDERLRAEIAPNGEQLIGFVGRLAAEKQIEDLRVLDDLPGTRLVIIGNGPQEESLRRVLPNAHFAGFRGGADLGRHVASLDVFVHPGEAETFCQTIQEAMAAAVPVVAVGRGGPLDLVDVGQTGWLYQPGDLQGLRSAVQHLTGDDAARARFSAAAWSAVQGRSWESICNQLVGHYSRAVEVNRRRLDRRAKDLLRGPFSRGVPGL
ncbi:phosphatidylinositol alpha 1,6-mannosyltransferase [Nesterenkonia lacusekhoensis]|uniref:D-inositol 3-phosphate glycosyltransferase n=2 Tax=Nesterenkonia lacusekhoensis TaxID=150832 RepID=A0ABS4SXX2_9MICC|nr:glycosyltransferase family 1 protein [Nesterenkonia lacusekhoensis]MBP2317044.1 phosphatidylinositol alpha 1,6-mannosyltransferase [Nesterenkonia lacusekhoensis]